MAQQLKLLDQKHRKDFKKSSQNKYNHKVPNTKITHKTTITGAELKTTRLHVSHYKK